MSAAAETVVEIPLRDLRRDQELNVRIVDERTEGIQQLADSIKAQGILEPVTVAPENGGKTYRLIFGFRRAAAAKVAGLVTVPAIVRKLTDQEIREAQLVENLQREDLNAVDEARALKELLAKGDVTQIELAKRIGKSQPYVANRLRLLELPERGQQLVGEGKISPAVAHEILKLPASATRERNRAIKKAEEELAQRGDVSPTHFRWTINAEQRSFQERTRKEKLVAAAKVPKCPAKGCGKNGVPPRDWEETKDFRCAAGHRWSPSTGKLAPKEPEYAGAYHPPPKPTLPEVDQDVATSLTPDQIAKRLLEAIKATRSVELGWRSGTRASVILGVDLPAAKGAKVPEFRFQDGKKSLELKSASWQPDDARRRRAAQEREELVAWLATFGRAKKPGGA